MLSLGIASVSALFSVVNKVLLEPLPYRDPRRLVQLVTNSAVGEERLASIPKFLFWSDHNTSFESIAASDLDSPSVSLTQGPERRVLETARVSAQYFHVLGAPLAFGRSFSATEDSPAGPPVAVISYQAWTRYLHAPLAFDARPISLDNVTYKIVGVLAPGAHLESNADIWLPLRANRRSLDHIGRLHVIARLLPSVSLKDADADLATGVETYLLRFGSNRGAGAPPRLFREQFHAIPLRDAVVGNVRPALFLLMGAVGFLLAIACANTAIFLLARASRRTREIAVRLATGAARSQILTQLLSETVLLALAAAVISLVLGYGAVHALLSLSPADLPRMGANGSAITLDWRFFAFTAGLSVLVGIVCGVIPAAHASRTDINILIKDSASTSGMEFRRNRWRSLLMIAEISLSLVLLAGAGLLIRTFVAQRAVTRGFDERNVVIMDMSLTNPRFDQASEVAQLVHHAEQRLKTLPGVQTIAATSALPLASTFPIPFAIVVNDRSMLGDYSGTAVWRSVSPEYFKVFHIRLLRGRAFTEQDNENAARVALVNRAMAKRYWPALESNPIGDFISIGAGMEPGSTEPPRQIVGIVADVREAGFDREPAMYVPLAQVSGWMTAYSHRLRPIVWAIRNNQQHPAPGVAIRNELAALSAGQPIGQPRTMHQMVAASSARAQFYMALLGVFAAIALLLTASGLYGLMTYTVDQRFDELAIRSALGASPADVRLLVVLQAVRLTMWGTAAGVLLAVALARITVSLLFGVQTWDPLVLGLVAALVIAVSLIAAYIPSVRASRVNPASALRA
jgi:putative ABC transport system permease protein